MSLGSMTLAAVNSPADRLDTLLAWPWDVLDRAAPRTLGWHAIAWAEGWSGFPGLDGFEGLRQPNGPRARKRFRLTQRQRRFFLWFYALDEEAQWLFIYAVRRLAKGSGKSPFAAVHSLVELLAPVRLERFDNRAPGGCVGRPVDMPLVQIAATAESQTANTMRMVRAFAPKGSHVADFYNLDPGKTRYYSNPEGTLEVITSSVTASEGAESTFVVEDEQEHWVPSKGGPLLAATIADNLAKSGARALGTSNAWIPGVGCVAESDFAAWVLQEEGRTKGDGRILYDAVISPADMDMSDLDSLRAGLEFVYADCDWKKPHEVDPNNPDDLRPVPGAVPDVRPIIKRIWAPQSTPSDSMRKYGNRPQVAEDAWTTPAEWALLVDSERLVVDGEEIVMFFDGSKSSDATALLGCCVSDGHTFAVGVWEPDPGDPESVVPVLEVDATVAMAKSRWKVCGFFADVREWESFTKVSWPEMFGELEVSAVPGGKDPQAIAWDMRTKTFEFTAECELTLAEIEAGAFTHDGDGRVARHVGNMRRRPNRYGVSVGKEAPDSPLKIDAGVCVVGVRMVRRRLLAVRATKPKGKRAGRVVAWGSR